MRSYRFPAMGTEVQVLLPVDHGDAVTSVRELFVRWEQALSRFLPDSELARLNARAGEAVPVSALLYEVVSTSVQAAEATGGAFDPTLLRQLVRIGYAAPFESMNGEAPLPLAGFPASGGGWRSIELDPSTRTVTVPAGCSLDFGGIAKGMAVDAALDVLDALGVAPALVSAGGDLSVRGAPPGVTFWPVLVGDDPDGPVVPLVRGALATSGVARRSWLQGGRRRHHLLDPATGEPADGDLREVTVAASTCTSAEVAATAAFVLGSRRGANLLSTYRLAGLLTYRDGTRHPVGAWPSLLPDAA